jgi:hypothetical protein
VARQKNVLIVLNKIRDELQTLIKRMEIRRDMLSMMGLPTEVDVILDLDIAKTKSFISLVNKHIKENTNKQTTIEGENNGADQKEFFKSD